MVLSKDEQLPGDACVDTRIVTKIPSSALSRDSSKPSKVVVYRSQLAKRCAYKVNTLQTAGGAETVILPPRRRASTPAAKSFKTTTADELKRTQVKEGEQKQSTRQNSRIPSVVILREDDGEMRDDKEVSSKHRSPLGLHLRIRMMSAPVLSDVTSLPSMRVPRSENDTGVRDEIKKESVIKSFAAKQMADGDEVENELVAVSSTPKQRPAKELGSKQQRNIRLDPYNRIYRSTYMNEMHVRRNENKTGKDNVNKNGDSDNNQNSSKRKSGHLSTEEVLPRCSKGIVSIPPELAIDFGLLESLAELSIDGSTYALNEKAGPFGIQERIVHESMQYNENEQPPKVGHEGGESGYILVGENKRDYTSTPTKDSTNVQLMPSLLAIEHPRQNDKIKSAPKVLITSRNKKRGKWKQVVARQVGLRHNRISKGGKGERLTKMNQQQSVLEKVFGFRGKRRRGMPIDAPNVDKLSVLEKMFGFLGQRHKGMPIYAPNVGELPIKSNLTEDVVEKTRYSDAVLQEHQAPFEIDRSSLFDYLFALCGLGSCVQGFLTCMSTEEGEKEKPPEQLSDSQRTLEIDGSSMYSYFSDDGSDAHGKTCGPSNFPKPEEHLRQEFSILKSSAYKEPTTKLLSATNCGDSALDTTETHTESPADTSHRKSVTFNPVVTSLDPSTTFDTDSLFGECLALVGGSCVPCTQEENKDRRLRATQQIALQQSSFANSKAKIKPEPSSCSEGLLKYNEGPGKCIPVTRGIMFQLNELFTERKKMKHNSMLSVKGTVPSALALQRRLLRLGGDRVCSLSNPGNAGFAMQQKDLKSSKVNDKKLNWNSSKSLLDDESSYNKMHSSAARLWKVVHKKDITKENKKKAPKMTTAKNSWTVQLFR